MAAERAMPAFGTWDGHCHSGFARHGGGGATDAFAGRALALGFTRVTFTEHPVFPTGILAPAVHEGIYLDGADLARYVRDTERVRDAFAGRLEVRVGFEIDYVPGMPDFPLTYLGPLGDRVEDAVLSLHYVPGPGGRLVGLDIDPDEVVAELVPYYGGVDALRRAYWEMLEEAIERACGWGLAVPRRLSHLDVVGRFRDRLPVADPARDREAAARVLDRAAATGFAIEVNAKGLELPLRREAHPAAELLADAVARGLPLVYGSDAHASADVGWHRDALVAQVAAARARAGAAGAG